MGKDVILEISWLRPLKLIGLANIFCAIIAFILTLVLEDWVISDRTESYQYYMSLWTKCQKQPSEESPTNATVTEEDWNCEESIVLGGYMTVVQALIVIPLIIAIVAFIIGCVAYCKREWRFLYKIAGVILIVGAVLVLVAVILFPIMFLDELPFYAFFWFGWGYGIAWAAMCFLFTAGVLFLIRQDKKEIYHTRKTMTL